MSARETLWLAPTRPAMRYGVPIEALYLNTMTTFVGGMIAGSPFYWLAGVVLHYALFRPLAAWDPTFFLVLRMWLATKGVTPSSDRYGAPTLLPLAPARGTAREYQTCV